MMRLKSKLLSLNADKTVKVKVYTPANCDEVRIPFKKDKIAKVVGKLAQIAPPSEEDEGSLMAGVLVQNGFDLSLMAPDDLREYAGLTTTTITCKQHVTLSSASMDLIKWALEGTFGAIEEIGSKANAKEENVDSKPEDEEMKNEPADEEIPMEATQTYLVMGCVIIRYDPRTREVELEWEGNMMNDGVADAVMAVLLTVESSPASVKRKVSFPEHILSMLIIFTESAKQHHHHHHDHHQDELELPNPHSQVDAEERFTRLLMMLEAQFGSDISPIERPRLPKTTNGAENGTSTPNTKPDPDSADQTPKPADGEDDTANVKAELAELARLQSLGIPVPGIEIKVDKHVARVWLEDLEVECANAVMRDRVRVVIERAVETVANMWTETTPTSATNGEAKELDQAPVPKGAEIETKA